MATNIISVTTGNTPSGGYGKPYYVPTTGRVYMFLRKSTASVAMVSFPLDDTSGIGTAENTDSANEVAATNINNINALTSFQDPANPNDLYAVAYGQNTGGNSCVEWWHFDATDTTNTANGSWVAGGQVIASGMVRAAGTGINHAQMCVLSNGHKVVIYAGPSDRIKGTDYGRIYYNYHNGTAWQTATLVEGTTADAVQYQYPGLVLGKSDLVHFFWWNGTNYRTRSRTSGDSLGTAANIGSSNDTAQPPPATYYLSGTDELIYYLHTASDGHPQYNLITNDGTPAADQEIDDVVVYDQGTAFQTTFQMSPNPNTGDLWAAYADSATRDIWRVDGSAWGTATEMADGQTAEDLMMNVVETDENAVILIAVWQDASASQMVGEYYVISTGGQQITGTGLGTTAGFGDATLEMEVLGTGLGAAAGFGNASVKAEILGTGLGGSAGFGDATLEANIDGTGLGAAAGFGDATLEMEVLATGLGTTAGFGNATVQEASGQEITAEGLGTTSGFGDGTLEMEVLGTGLGATSGFGDATLESEILGTGLGTTTGFGDATLEAEILATGLGTTSGFGDAVLEMEILADGLDSNAGFGTSTLSSGQQIIGTGLGTTSGFGDATLEMEILADGLDCTAGFGTSTLSSGQQIIGTGLGTTSGFGDATLEMEVLATGLGSAAGFGDATLEMEVLADGLGTTAGFGDGVLEMEILADGLGSSAGFGTAVVIDATAIQSINPDGLATSAGFGTAQLILVLPGSTTRVHVVENVSRAHAVENINRSHVVENINRTHEVES